MTLPIASLQLYTLAKEFSADMNGSLERLAGLGLTHVEAFDFVGRAPELRAALDASGLVSPTGHAPLLSDELWTPKGSIPTPGPEKVFEAASTIGIQTVIDPFVAPERWFTQAGADDIAARLNAAAEAAEGFGLTVGYHNHAQEFIESFDGLSAFEYVIAQLDERVKIELDLFWALTGGQDVPALVSRLGERLIAVHVKDGIVPTENPWAPGVERAPFDQRAAGTGEVPLVESLRANDNIQYAVIEYDEAPGDVFEDIAASLEYVRNEGLVK